MGKISRACINTAVLVSEIIVQEFAFILLELMIYEGDTGLNSCIIFVVC